MDDPAPATLPNSDVPVGPEGGQFYLPPDPPTDAAPGDLIWARPLEAPEGTRGYAILYWSTTVDGTSTAVSGVVFEPSETELQSRPVFAWAHGPFGMGDACAPSQGYLAGDGASLPVAMRAIAEGAVFVASDYQGLGPPGDHPYLVNEAAGRNLLDSIRAAVQLTGAQTRAVIVGHSQGASAALLAAELRPSYAPDVELAGTAAVTVPFPTRILDGSLSEGPYFGYVLMTAQGYRSAYPELGPDAAVLPDEGQRALQTISTQCLSETLRRYAYLQPEPFGLSELVGSEAFARRVQDNEPGGRVPDSPVLLVHGMQDDIIPADDVRDLADRYCRSEVPVIVREYPDHGHVDVMVGALDDIVEFLRSQIAGEPITGSWAC